MKGLRINHGNFIFVIDIKDVIHIASIEELNGQLDDIKIINLSKYLGISNIHDKEIVFIGSKDRIVGISVENAANVINIESVSPFEKDIFMIDFILSIVSFEGKMGYLIDSEKMLEVAYEQESITN